MKRQIHDLFPESYVLREAARAGAALSEGDEVSAVTCAMRAEMHDGGPAPQWNTSQPPPVGWPIFAVLSRATGHGTSEEFVGSLICVTKRGDIQLLDSPLANRQHKWEVRAWIDMGEAAASVARYCYLHPDRRPTTRQGEDR